MSAVKSILSKEAYETITDIKIPFKDRYRCIPINYIIEAKQSTIKCKDVKIYSEMFFWFLRINVDYLIRDYEIYNQKGKEVAA